MPRIRRRRRRYRRRPYRKRRYNRRRGSSRIYKVAKRAAKHVLNQRVERKQYISNPGQITIYGNWAQYWSPLQNVQVGSNAWDRTGSSIYLTRMNLRGYFVLKSDVSGAGLQLPVRDAALRIMLIGTNFDTPGASGPSWNNIFTDVTSTLFQESTAGAQLSDYFYGMVDHRQKKYQVLYDKRFGGKTDIVPATGTLPPISVRVFCSVRIGRKLKYDDQDNTTPQTMEGKRYFWVIFPHSPLKGVSDEIGFLSLYGGVYFTDS